MADDTPLALEDIRVVEAASLFAGPTIGCLLGDFGADVVKVESPRGDSLRTLGLRKDGVSLWWALLARNKRCTTLDLSHPRGQELMRKLVATADVFIEGFRPGTLERWGLSPDALRETNSGLVIVRTSGFGQTGPYHHLPGFGTLAECFSGFAYINGSPGEGPRLPPFALADTVAGLFGTFATLIALWWRDHAGGGQGQEIDLSLFEPLFWALGPLALVYDQLDAVQSPTANTPPLTAPRNLYKTKEGNWLGLSASTQSMAERVMRTVGRPDVIDEPWFSDHLGRVAHTQELDDIIQDWIGSRTAEQVLAAFSANEGAISPVYSIAEISADPQYRARRSITEVAHPKLGAIRMQNVFPLFTLTPGRVAHAGPELGEHNAEILGVELGLATADLLQLHEKGVI